MSESKQDYILEVKNLKKYFEKGNGTVHAVDDVSFSIERGHTLGVVGESGCGKSTLGRTILHLLSPTAGQVIFEGEDISNPSKTRLKELRKNMQMVFQDPYSSLNPRMTVSQLIAEPLLIYKACRGKKELEARVLEIMETAGIARRLTNAYPHELDGGRRQRVGIGRALALNPRFIVCDEPVSSLDVSIQAQILNLMQDLQKERNLTYIFVTHDLSVVRHISNEILVMYMGVVVEKADSKEIFNHRYHPYTKALISAIPQIDIDNRQTRIALKGEITSPIDPPKRCRFANRCIYATEQCRQDVPELKELCPGHFVSCFNAKAINNL